MSEQLPTGWARVTLRQLAGNGVFADGDWVESKDQDPNGSVRLIQLADVGAGRFIDKSSRFLTDRKAVELGCTFLEPGDVLISRMADPIGRACIFPGLSQRCVTVVDVCIVRASTERVDNRWLTATINSPQFRGNVELAASGTTRSRVSRGNLGSLELPLPPLNEQRRIVAKLEALQARSRRAREALDAVPPLLEKLRQSILAAAFRGDLTKDWRAKHKDVEPASELLKRIRTERKKKWEEAELAKMKAKGKPPTDDKWKAKYKEPEPVDATGLPELPRGWCWASVEEVGLIESGQTTDGLAEHASSASRDVPWFRVGDMNHKDNELVMRASEVWLSTEDVRRFGLHVRPEGTIVFPKRGGAIATNKKRRLAQPSTYDLNTMGIVPIESVADYVWAWFQTIDLGRLNTGTSVPQINHGDIAPLRVPVPPPAEAQLLANVVIRHLAALRQTAAGLVVTEGRLGELDRATLAKAFRGELVPQDPNDEPASKLLSRLRTRADSTGNTGKPKRGGARGPRTKAKADTNMLTRKDVTPTHLTTILKERGPLTAEALWTASQLEIDDFYDQLKDEEARGLLRESRGDSPTAPRVLEAVA